MKDMLEKLRKLDPETWEEFNDDLGSVICEHRCDNEEKYFTHKDCWTQVSEAWLQSCLQRACEKRGWSFQIILFNNPNRYGVSIVKNETWIEPQHNGDSPASALLAAYLEALRHE